MVRIDTTLAKSGTTSRNGRRVRVCQLMTAMQVRDGSGVESGQPSHHLAPTEPNLAPAALGSDRSTLTVRPAKSLVSAFDL